MGKKDKAKDKAKDKDEKKVKKNKEKKSKKDKSGKQALLKKTTDDVGRVSYICNDVRIGYANGLHDFPVIKGEQQEKGSAPIMLSKSDPRDMQIKDELLAISMEIEKENDFNIKDEKRFIKDGAELETPKPDFWVVSLNCPTNSLPTVLGHDGKEVIKDKKECKIYSGCRVNVKFSPWPQNNKHGKRVNAQFIAVQFNRDDDPMDASHVTEKQASGGFDQVEAGSMETEADSVIG